MASKQNTHMRSQKPLILPPSGSFPIIQKTVNSLGLTTVCQQAHCPNQAECWSGGTATFMVMGDTCTRGCKFCNVKTFYKGQPLDPQEPKKLASAVQVWGLDYVVITSVDRDDLPDQGAAHVASCIRELKKIPHLLVEVLIPDFRGQTACLEAVVQAKPDVLAHNIETVQRLQHLIRDPRASYEQSLIVLEKTKQISGEMFTKSSIMLGFGEQDQEVLQSMKDLREKNVDILTLGQYLRPSQKHLPVQEYISLEKFNFFRMMGEELGFLYVAAGPLVRSSYRAGEFFVKGVLQKRFK